VSALEHKTNSLITVKFCIRLMERLHEHYSNVMYRPNSYLQAAITDPLNAVTYSTLKMKQENHTMDRYIVLSRLCYLSIVYEIK